MKRLGFISILAVFFCASCFTQNGKQTDVITGKYWKNQVVKDILPYWTNLAQDTLNGGFFTTLDSVWKPFGDTRKYPSMLSRHVFGYSVGYLLSGDQHYLDIARKTVDYLLDHAWDKEYGGWYDVLDEQGNPLETTKNMFIQVYSTTGLAMYYFVTRDPRVLEYVEKSNHLIEANAWDQDFGGYYNKMTRDWKVLDSTKSISSEITPVSGYLLYLYQATHEEKYLDQCRKILDMITRQMIDPESDWVLESFSREWQYQPGAQNETEISPGHNIEVAWMLYRYYLITGRTDYLDRANRLGAKLFQFCNQPDLNFWYNSVGRLNPEQTADITYWWVQAYGIMFDLISYRIQNQNKYLDDYRKGASFWDSCFVDRKNGDTQFSVLTNGKVKEALKANQFKASYHNAENGMLNYLYLNAWVNKEPIELYFYLSGDRGDKPFYASPIEGNDLMIKSIETDNKSTVILSKDRLSANIKGKNNTRLKVTLITN
ncbi:MAG: AGE family epimerase/isomerase [Bacteroidales bacterium]|nr:AGE family epimerase/isomerase [Bacteroidales bacterium]